MSIPDLIELLAADAKPVQRFSLHTIIWPSLATGALCGLVVMAMSIGFRTSFSEANAMGPLLVRIGLGLGFGVAGLAALVPSLRPDVSPVLPKRIITVASILLAIIAAGQLSSKDLNWSVLYLGASLGRSPWTVALLAIPPFVSLAFGVRFEAPTHLNVTGAALGLTSGGVGATIYAFGFTESSTPLGLAWFSVGIGLTTLGGMLVAPRLLRW